MSTVLMEKTSPRWLSFLSFKENLHFCTISKATKSWVFHAPHLFHLFTIYDNNLVTNDVLDRAYSLCGNQIRSIFLDKLPNISESGLLPFNFANLPQLSELQVYDCENVQLFRLVCQFKNNLSTLNSPLH